jgi:hypothetical protein
VRHVVTKLFGLLLCAGLAGCAASAPPAAAVAPTVKAGSMARFIVHDGLLYALNPGELRVYDFQGPSGLPAMVGSVGIPAEAETLFPYGRLLFVGTRQGMFVYELGDHPASPTQIGMALHAVSCDPVVVENDIAYVTLREGSACRRGRNVLLVFDVKNATQPRLLEEVQLKSPHGLGVDGGSLFVADAKYGLLVFDVRDPHAPKLMTKLPGVIGYDVIAHAGRLFVSATDGLYQFRYGPEGAIEPEPLSRIPIGAPRLEVATDPSAR